MPKQTNRKRTAKAKSSSPKIQKPEELADAGTQLAATPMAFIKRFGEEMDRLFDDFGVGRSWLNSISNQLGQGAWAPQVEMFERDGELVVRADLPGLTRDDVKVDVSEGSITIEGERRNEKEEKGEGFYRSERNYGKFYRRLPLPEGIDASEATATFRDGVLEITMDAKRKEPKSRRLPVQGDPQPQAKRKAA